MQLEVVCQARSTSSEVTSYKVLRRDSVTSHSEMLFETKLLTDLHLTDWSFIYLLVYCQILLQQDLDETGNYYFTKKPPF